MISSSIYFFPDSFFYCPPISPPSDDEAWSLCAEFSWTVSWIWLCRTTTTTPSLHTWHGVVLQCARTPHRVQVFYRTNQSPYCHWYHTNQSPYCHWNQSPYPNMPLTKPTLILIEISLSCTWQANTAQCEKVQINKQTHCSKKPVFWSLGLSLKLVSSKASWLCRDKRECSCCHIKPWTGTKALVALALDGQKMRTDQFMLDHILSGCEEIFHHIPGGCEEIFTIS